MLLKLQGLNFASQRSVLIQEKICLISLDFAGSQPKKSGETKAWFLLATQAQTLIIIINSI